VAVLPHLPLENLDFDPARPEVQLTAELRQKLALLPAVELRSPVEINRQVQRLREERLPVDQWLPALASRLDVDYVLWGSYVGASRGGVRQLRSVIFSRRSSRELPPLVVNDQPASEVVGLLFEQMTRAPFLRQGAPELSTALAAATRSERLLGELVTPVSTSAETRGDVLEAYEALEQAMAHQAGEAAAAPLLEQSQAALLRALVKDPRDPLALMLLASCHFNLSRLQAAAGDKAAAQRSAAAMLEALSQAYEERSRCRFESVKREIMADYALLVSRNYKEAVNLYGALAADGEQTPLSSALRAHWMLAGIHSGDWGVPGDNEVVDADLARKHLIQILAHWPDSSQALYIRRNLRWKEEDGSHFNHVPLEHTAVLTGR
jgi:tetratricopeptide (TPR) repeat protein